MREFKVEDLSTYPIKLQWDVVDPKSEAREMLAFPAYTAVPCTKLLTFYRTEPFDLEAHYADPDALPAGASTWLARYTVSKIKPNAKGEASTVKVKVRMTPNGTLEVTGAQVVEEVEVPVEEPKEGADAAAPAAAGTDAEMTDAAAPDAAAAAAPTAAAATPKFKTITRKTDLPVATGTTALPKERVNKLRELEVQLAAADKLVFDTEERRNALEAYVYEMRGKVESVYAEFVEEPVGREMVVQYDMPLS